ncbi:TetR/AcrR family transcriptional regulator [Streptomyces wuyuanensis]|uniref:TetR/AcrR family transcriptional regulator, transcriptional repressor for nem operon n=1 Tax=Streptomyces wuyuanensis TaxID=1196353 RepID=A0A1G9ZZZ4_9ACTN|nr:TetR/AcrR family transcriptional regulator [Streptomyces wuyuanensis]SDN26878.1 TetR/AcrR family transcriptional regulator, transcriptional repressor for nem operon [Streptomyces wuyuanensis]
MARTREFDTDAAVAAAMEAFRRTGYGGTSMRDLAEAMEIGSGSIYSAFGNKEGLYLAALDLYRRRYALPFIQMLRASGDAREAVRAAFEAVIDEVTCGPGQASCLIVGAAMERAHSDAQVAERLRATTQLLELTLFEVITEAQGRGEIAADRSAADLAAFLAMTFQGLRVMGAISSDRAALTRAAEVALSCIQ